MYFVRSSVLRPSVPSTAGRTPAKLTDSVPVAALLSSCTLAFWNAIARFTHSSWPLTAKFSKPAPACQSAPSQRAVRRRLGMVTSASGESTRRLSPGMIVPSSLAFNSSLAIEAEMARTPPWASAPGRSVVSKLTFSPRKVNDPTARKKPLGFAVTSARHVLEQQDPAVGGLDADRTLANAERVELQRLECGNERRNPACRCSLLECRLGGGEIRGEGRVVERHARALPVMSMASTSPLRARPVRLGGIESVPLSRSTMGACRMRTGALKE